MQPAAVPVERSHAALSSYLAAVQLTQLRQFRQEHNCRDRTCTGHALQEGVLLLPRRMGEALNLQLSVYQCQFGLQSGDVVLGQCFALCPGPMNQVAYGARVPTRRLRGVHQIG